VVVYGYDAQGVHVADPASGTLTYFTWDEFVSMWSILDGMALAVSPW
jgi:ABC-type bacteriocin/lantibiotic exporter with double-glycine peptidase domain